MSLTKSNTRMLEGDIDASNITGVLPVANGGTGSSTAPEAASAVFSESFESSEQTIPASAGNVEVTHGLGSIPKIFQVVVRCKTTEMGYSTGDEVDVTTSGFMCSIYSNNTVIGFTQKPSLYLSHKDGSAVGNITTANWKLVFRAFA